LKTILIALAVLLTGCATDNTYRRAPSQVIYEAPLPQQGIIIYTDAPLYRPVQAGVQWAPPPVPLEIIPYQPYPEAIWIGGYWVWQDNWVWTRGRWAGRSMRSAPAMTVNPIRTRQPDPPAAPVRMPPPVSNYVPPGPPLNAQARTPAVTVPASAPQPKSIPEQDHARKDRRGYDDGRLNDRR
jgi:hypothetical protein